ncbi:putative inositol 2-dehydrogenase, partial [Paenibacillus sp. 598K]|uniref:Gfo/Idh/MocA family oxidoreductase n=1 Tax=Paenibacillus sp. 598K TaxID=1117987 RepID=UPI000FF9C178
MTKIRIGIIGAGRIGRIHAENLGRLPHAEVIAISDPFADQALRDWAKELGIGMVSTQSEDILQSPAIDAVLICSPTDTHVTLIRQAAAAGKHIF